MNMRETSFSGDGPDAGPLQVGGWFVEPALKRLSKGGKSVQVEPRIMHVLTFLAARAGDVVPRPEILEAVWGEVVVNEEALTHAVSQLRRVFGDDPKSPRYIQTIHKTGYRLVAPVRAVPAPVGPGSDESHPDRDGTAAVPGALHAEDGYGEADRGVMSRLMSRRGLIAAASVAGVLAVILIMALMSRTTPSVRRPPVALEVVPFTAYPGHEECPSISPDGSRIAFSWNGEDEDNYDVYVKQSNTEIPLRLTETGENKFYAVWSPDGADLAYAAFTTEGAAVHIIPAIGGAPRKILDLEYGVAGLDWSPDGRYLAYSSRRVYCGPMRIYLYSFETGRSEQLTSPFWSSQGDFRPAFSPDGKNVAFIRGDRTWLKDIFIVPTTGGEARRLTSSQHYISGLDWMPDGESLVFSAGPSSAGDLRLWRLSLEDGSLTWLPTPGQRPARPSIAAHRPRLVYEEQSLDSDIERVATGGTGEGSTTIVTSTRHDYSAQYSPGGNYISFISTRSGSPQIWVCDRDGGCCRQLTHFEDAYIENPCWSHDEATVAFTAAPGSYTAIYLADIETGEVKRLSTSDRHEMCLGWSREGDWLYCKSERDDAWWVWKMSSDGSEVVDIMEKDVFRLAESADGEHLLYSRSDTTGVWSACTDGSNERCLVNEPGTVVPCGWREIDGGIYFFNLDQGSVCLRLLDPSTGKSSMLTSEADFHTHNLDISPDGRNVIFDRVRHTGSDLSLVESL
jgi:Tol biopolymer transport system component/DNA-binding winged helix-turn-helix (wHTH) protein